VIRPSEHSWALLSTWSVHNGIFPVTRSDHRCRRRPSVGPPTYLSTHLVSLDIHLGRPTVSDRQSFDGMEAHHVFTLVGRFQILTPMRRSSRLSRRYRLSSRISVFSFGPPLCATRSDSSVSLRYSRFTWSLTSGEPLPLSLFLTSHTSSRW